MKCRGCGEPAKRRRWKNVPRTHCHRCGAVYDPTPVPQEAEILRAGVLPDGQPFIVAKWTGRKVGQ